MPTGLRARRAARDAAKELEKAGVPEPAASAEVLLSELLGIRRGEISLHDAPLSEGQVERYESWVRRRADREPVQRILGYAYFRNVVLRLNDETLIPRPDTETVVDVVLERLDRRGGDAVVLDVGTGSGAIAISVAQERPRARVHATDLSETALMLARENAEKNDVSVEFHLTDLVPDRRFIGEEVGLLVSNPPYIADSALDSLAPEVRDWDPQMALDGGPDGLRFYRRVFAEAPPVLAAGADVVLEVGDGQAPDVLKLGAGAGYEPLGVRDDLAGTPRAVLLRGGG